MRLNINCYNSLLSIFVLMLSVFSSALELQQELNSYMSESRRVVEKELTLANCSEELSKLNLSYENLKSVNWGSFSDKAHITKIIKSSFYLRIALRNQFLNLSQQNLASFECENEVRRMTVNLRFMEEYLAKNTGFDEDVDVLKGTEPYLLVNPKFDSFKLQSGDIVISRGNSVVSAAIAQIGQQKSHFSHAALIYVDELSKKTYAVEAHIEIGSDAAPIEEAYSTDGKVRAVVYRHRDTHLAQTAAREMYQRVTRAKLAKRPIAYNFSMDLSKEEELFCSQIPFSAFKNSSNGKVIFGSQYLTRLSKRVQKFLKGIGVNVSQTYSPSDVEFDNQLELVAEWRDFRRAHQTHRKDAVMNRIYNWLEKGDDFDLSKKNGQVMLIQLVRNMPLFKYLMEDKVAPNITSQALAYMMVMNYVGDRMLDDLIIQYEKVVNQKKIFMDMQDMIQALEQEKIKDIERQSIYSNWKTKNPNCNGEGNMCLDEPEKPHFIDHFIINLRNEGK